MLYIICSCCMGASFCMLNLPTLYKHKIKKKYSAALSMIWSNVFIFGLNIEVFSPSVWHICILSWPNFLQPYLLCQTCSMGHVQCVERTWMERTLQQMMQTSLLPSINPPVVETTWLPLQTHRLPWDLPLPHPFLICGGTEVGCMEGTNRNM